MPEWITKYWFEWAFGLIAAALVAVYKRLFKKNKALQDGMRALLRDRIIQSYNYYKDKGYCPIYARENLIDMYDAYHALGGNGTITHLKDELMEMSTTPTDSKGE